ncbi:hypothetical protein GFM44_23115 [Rhizobium leguminosarum bv. viciae]|nr:hypothetical protein [Rhizobium leguminosarum bv. viciae]
MQRFEGTSGDLPEQGQDSVERIVDDRPNRFLDLPLHDGQSLSDFIADNKKRMADAEAPSERGNGEVLQYPDDAHLYEQRRREEEQERNSAIAEGKREVEADFRAGKTFDAAIDEGLHKQEYFKRVAGRGQKHSVDQAGFAQKDRQDLSGAGHSHSAAQAAALAEESMKRNAARPSTPSAGRTI